MKKIIKLTEADLTHIVRRVIEEQGPLLGAMSAAAATRGGSSVASESCLREKDFYRDSIGGPQTRRLVYQKDYQGKIYQIVIGRTGELSKTVYVIDGGFGGSSQECSWVCDNSELGIKVSGCKKSSGEVY